MPVTKTLNSRSASSFVKIYAKLIFLLVASCGSQVLLAQEVPPKMVELRKDDKVYNSGDLDAPPTFPGGITQFYNFVGKNYRTSKIVREEGKIVIEFIIERDGSLSNIKVLQDLGHASGEEAVRVLKLSPKWIPGEQNGKKVRTLYSLPISIRGN